MKKNAKHIQLHTVGGQCGFRCLSRSKTYHGSLLIVITPTPVFDITSFLQFQIKKYTFFSYEVSEALHLSEDERNIMTDCLKIIRMELERGVDKHSKTLLVNYIELLLNYCMRFYERQFATRSHSNRDVLTRFEGLLDDYFEGELAERDGLPTVKYFADKLCLSSNYFGDMFKKETGKTPQEYIQEKVIELAKERMSDRRETVSRVAYSLGFQYPQHFCRLFKKRVGCTPNEYRAQNLLL